MTEHLSSAAQDKRPTLLIGEDGTFREVSTADTNDYHRQQLGRTELSFDDFDPLHDKDSARMTAAAKLEELLLDLDESDSDADMKAEVEAALEAVTEIEPDKDRGLSRIGVAAKEVERLERYVANFQEAGDKRLEGAISKLNSARLVVEVLAAAEDEQSATYNKVTSGENNTGVAEVHARIAMADAHNGLVRRNRSRRNTLTKVT